MSISSRIGRRALCTGVVVVAALVWTVATATARLSTPRLSSTVSAETESGPLGPIGSRPSAPAGTYGSSYTQLRMRTVAGSAVSAAVVHKLALARMATAKYVNDLERAKTDGYVIITKMITNMGYHFLNPKVKGFDVRKPAILVYEHQGTRWQLGAVEWVYTAKPAKPPLPGATFGTFGAACHYVDGTFVPSKTQDACAKTSPQTGAKLAFWHPLLYTMHVWLWYPNPSGLFASLNPLVAPFNKG